MYAIYGTQNDSDVASTIDVTLLTFANEGNEFSDYVFEV